MLMSMDYYCHNYNDGYIICSNPLQQQKNWKPSNTKTLTGDYTPVIELLHSECTAANSVKYFHRM